MCPRCHGLLIAERIPFTVIDDIACLNCGWHHNPPTEYMDTPMRQFGLCACGRETLRQSSHCGRCHGARVSEGMRRKVGQEL
jgi:hypothetical protein